MVQLVVKTQGQSALHYLDVSDVSIKGNYSAKEIQDLKSQKSDFTQSFTLPFTKTNNDFFSHFYNVISVDGTFDSSIKCEADIYVDSNIVFSGYLQLLNVNNATQYYEALVFGVISNIATSLDEKKLNELDLSVFSHLLTAANVKDSWSGNTTYTTSASQTGEEILYPIADYGYDYNNETLNSTIEDGINATRLKPAINVKVLFEKILASIGYTINSTFFATNFFAKQYMTLANDSQTINATFQDSFRVGLSANSVNAGGVGTVTQILDLDDDTSTNPTGDFFDLTGNWDTANATPHYNVPFSGWYRFRVQVGYKFSLVFSATRGRLFIKKLNDANFSQQVFGVHNLDGDDTTLFNQLLSTDQTEDIVSDLGYYEVGDEIYFETQLTTIGTSNPPSLTIYKTQTSITLAHAPVIAEGATVNLSANNNIMPKEKQVDFISAICSRYNLIIEMDNNAANQLNIEPAQDYFDAGTSKDWSDKIDMNKDRVLKPTNEFRKAKINMSDLEDQDRLNNYWQETFGNAYNNFDTDLEGDFGEGDLEINTMFSSWNTKRPQGHNMLIAHLYKWDNGNIDFVEIKPKLFTYSGLKNCNPFKYWNTISGAFTNESQYPFCDHYLMAGNSVVGTDEDIRFKSKWAIDSQFYVDAQTTTDTYSKCWRKYLNNIYSEDSRILIANFYLTPEDISQFKYNDKIFVENSFYRINKISSYALGKNVSTKVELIKIIESNLNNKTFTVLGCDLTWFQSNINGTTVWQNSTGATVNPTQTCCEANNLTFDNNECYWNIPSTPDEPSNPPISWDATANINTTGGKVIVGETASSVVVNDSTQLYLEGTIRRLGKDASNGEILAWNSATNQTNWIANSGGGGTPGGSSTQVQYNQAGAFKGEAGFEYDEGNNRLTAPIVDTPILQSISGGTTLHQIYTVSQNMAILSNTSVDVYLNAGNATAGSKAFQIKSAVTGNIVFAVTDTGVIKAIGNKIQDSAGTDRIDVATAGTTKIQGNTQLLGSSPATLSGPDADKLILSSVDDLEFKIASGGASSKSFKFINNTTEVGSINSSGDLQIDGGLTTGGGTITIGGSNSNLELDAGSDIILEADQNGGGLDSTIQYPDLGGTNRIMLGVDNNVVILSNRAANGTVEIRANSSTAGGSGETTSAIFKDDAVVLIKEAEFSAGISDSGTIAAGTWNGTAIAQAKIADQAINEAKLQVSNAPVNGYVLTAQSGNTGGLTWAEQASGGGGSSSSIITQIFTIAYHSTSTSGFYITMSGALTNESTSLSTGSYHLILPCPFDGTIKRITSHHSNAVSNGTSKFELYIDGDDDDLVGDQRGSDLTVTNGYNVSGDATRAFTADCPSDWTFSKNETLAIKRTDSSGRGGATVSFVIEFDTST